MAPSASVAEKTGLGSAYPPASGMSSSGDGGAVAQGETAVTPRAVMKAAGLFKGKRNKGVWKIVDGRWRMNYTVQSPLASPRQEGEAAPLEEEIGCEDEMNLLEDDDDATDLLEGDEMNLLNESDSVPGSCYTDENELNTFGDSSDAEQRINENVKLVDSDESVVKAIVPEHLFAKQVDSMNLLGPGLEESEYENEKLVVPLELQLKRESVIKYKLSNRKSKSRQKK
ncbi:unnamed protein product [Amoebophrya sp. A25]|nr:unnamed protein product [Amoebophrya sp. A25]|eukprot:GSA25T00016647001.1